MSGVFSMAAHSVLQYLPDVATHEQTGCAHFSPFARAISFLPTSDEERMIQAPILVTRGKCFYTERNTLRYWLHSRSRRWQSVGFRDKFCHFSADCCGGFSGSKESCIAVSECNGYRRR
jgi:hypothetical protein